MEKWMLHLDEETRRDALVVLDECLAVLKHVDSEVVTSTEDGVHGVMIRNGLPLDGADALITLVHETRTEHVAENDALTIWAWVDGQRRRRFRFRHFPREGDPSPFSSGRDSATATIARWREELSIQPSALESEQAASFKRELATLAQGAAFAHPDDWEQCHFIDDARSPSLRLEHWRERREEQTCFLLGPPTPTGGGMSAELIAAFAELLSRHVHVTYDWASWIDTGLDVTVGPAPVVGFRRTTDLLLAMRAASKLPAGAALLPPTAQGGVGR